MTVRRPSSRVVSICAHPNSRQLVNNPPGLTATQTWVLRAVCDEAIRQGTLRLTLSQVAARLWSWMPDPVQAVDQALGPLVKRRYLVADDQPDLAETILHVTRQGFEAYAVRFIDGYQDASSRVLTWLADHDPGYNALDVAHACGISEFLAGHILEMAEVSALIRLQRHGHYVVVRSLSPELRRHLRGTNAL